MQVDPYLGQIAIWTADWVPKGWALCDGSLVSAPKNSALFSLIGTRYGGNGVTDFALPDLRGMTPVGALLTAGSGYQLGNTGGAESVALAEVHLPMHIHRFNVTDDVGTHEPIVDAIPATVNGSTFKYIQTAPDTAILPGATDPPEQSQPGGAKPHPNMQPYLVLNYIIAMQGIFPNRTQ